MKKNLIAIALTAILSLATYSIVQADDQKSDGTENSGQCHGGHKGGNHHHKDAGKGEQPAPAPSPAQ